MRSKFMAILGQASIATWLRPRGWRPYISIRALLLNIAAQWLAHAPNKITDETASAHVPVTQTPPAQLGTLLEPGSTLKVEGSRGPATL